MKKIIAVFLSALILFSLFACDNREKELNIQDQVYSKKSSDELYFYSSDSNLDLFLNDFYKRHSRSTKEYAINDMQLGMGGSCWKNWESMSLLWFDSTSNNFRQDSFSLIRQWIYSIPVDDYGYTWTSNNSLETSSQDPGSNTFGLGWPFPNYGSFSENDWEFNNLNKKENWSFDCVEGSINEEKVQNGFYYTSVQNATEISYSISNKSIDTKSNPFLEFDIRWAVGSDYENSNVDDIYVTFKQKNSSTVYTVKQSELTELSSDLTNLYTNHVYMPMYLNDNWGLNNIISDITITVKANEGKELTGKFWLNFVRANYDSRQVDNNFNLLSSLKQYYEFTGDIQVVKDNIEKYRKAIMFMVYNLGGNSGLIDLSNFVGHEGGVISDGIESTIGSSYWDVLSLSPKSIYAQVLFYQSLENTLYLENVVANENLNGVSPSIKLFNGTRKSFDLSKETLIQLMNKVKSEVQKPVNKSTKTGFFDEQTGRFIEGFNKHGDVVDYGSTIFNNMVLSANIATGSQAKSVCAWINGDRIIEGDNAKGYTGNIDDVENCGIYDYAFAPRVTTKKNYEQYTAGHSTEAQYSYASSCQDGGAILFTSYYDLLARFNTNGVNDAYKRLSKMKDWYLDVYNYSSENYGSNSFYRAFYMEKGISLQGSGTAGCLGLDSEFLENAIVYAIVPYAFFGLKGLYDGTLSITPSMPDSLSFWRMENLMFHNIRYDLQIGKNYILIESVRGNTLNQKIKVNIKYTGENPSFFIDGKKIEEKDYTFENNTVSIYTDFSAKKIEVK